MTSKIITYDLRKPGRNYNSLYEAIKSYPYWAHITESTWLIKTNDTCSQIKDALLRKMDYNDRLFVAELTGAVAWHNTIYDDEYVKKNL
ncbi:MAG TPA: CRISPR-associated protein Cas2 [Bacillota bacterium]|nr:CRISPR-associated protein Cas2 [Bacillota bacterium]